MDSYKDHAGYPSAVTEKVLYPPREYEGPVYTVEKPSVYTHWENPKEDSAEKRIYLIGRRFQDIVFSLLALLVLALPMLLVALIIWIDSPGASPIFSQNRVGKNGKIFRFYKFRSMVPHAEKKLQEVLPQNEMTGPVFKIKNDPRITRVGRFIRKTSIDELPQLLNVLKGDMSLVGPRPALPARLRNIPTTNVKGYR